MERQIFTTLTESEIQELMEDCFKKVLEHHAPKPKQDTGDFIGIKEASEFTKIAIGTLYDYTHKHKIPYRKIGKRLLFSKKELSAWIDTHKLH